MKSSKLIELHMQHLVLDNPDYLAKNEDCAMLFGTDEFKVNYRKQAVRLPSLGWIKCDLDVNFGRVEWAAVKRDGDGWAIVFGNGNPYDPSNVDMLPSKNGKISALPHAMTVGLDLPLSNIKTVFDM